MKRLGSLKYFLDIEIVLNPLGLFLSQRKYALEIIAEHGLFGAKSASTPLQQNHKLATSAEFFDHLDRYRRLISKLIYLSLTCPEHSYAVHILA